MTIAENQHSAEEVAGILKDLISVGYKFQFESDGKVLRFKTESYDADKYFRIMVLKSKIPSKNLKAFASDGVYFNIVTL